MRQNEIHKPRRTENTFFIMQTVSGTVTEFRFVPDVIAKDGNSFLLPCLKGETLISLCLLIEVYGKDKRSVKRELYFITWLMTNEA